MLDLVRLDEAIADDAAIRRIRRLQPAGGPGEKIFPPTYPGNEKNRKGNAIPEHIFERRQAANGKKKWCVVLDSVQSQANRFEEGLATAADEYGMPVPYITIDLDDEMTEAVGQITSLTAPHRAFDAILRDAAVDGEPFLRSAAGRRLAASTPRAASAMLELSPNGLLFGCWHSQGASGGLGTKFQRVLVSEIMGIDTPVVKLDRGERNEPLIRASASRKAIRIDPLGTSSSLVVHKSATKDDWAFDPADLKGKSKKVKPSDINHGNIIGDGYAVGTTCAYAEQRTVITVAGIRKLRFGNPERNMAGRAMVAALGLLALYEQERDGYSLRSRCDLVPDGDGPLELVHTDGTAEPIMLNVNEARALYRNAYERAEAVGFTFQNLHMQPQAKLVELVRRNREQALSGANDTNRQGETR